MNILGGLFKVKKVNGYEIRPWADFYEANFEGADFGGANLKGVNFKRANLRGVDLRGANLYRAVFNEADLRGADLRGAFPYGVDVGRAFSHEAGRRGIRPEDKYLRLEDIETKLEGIIYDEETKCDTYSILDDHIRKDKYEKEK